MASVREKQITSLLSGSAAGLSVDLALYPLDTIKTRLQSADGFIKSGGFRGIYAGLGSVAVGSMPGAALFFATYEGVKWWSRNLVPQKYLFTTHMAAASGGEVVACLVRVPVEVVKQRAMVSRQMSSTVLSNTIRQEGVLGLYRGYWSTVMREVPFSLLQFPLWEYLKHVWSRHQGYPPEPWQSAVCGAAAGMVAAGLTTPLDVAKTRIMLAKKGSHIARGSIYVALCEVYGQKGFQGLYAGVVPRMLWISLGGAIFLGVYDKAKKTCKSFTTEPS